MCFDKFLPWGHEILPRDVFEKPLFKASMKNLSANSLSVISASYAYFADLTLRITGWQWSAAELPVRVDAVVMRSFKIDMTKVSHMRLPPPTCSTCPVIHSA